MDAFCLCLCLNYFKITVWSYGHCLTQLLPWKRNNYVSNFRNQRRHFLPPQIITAFDISISYLARIKCRQIMWRLCRAFCLNMWLSCLDLRQCAVEVNGTLAQWCVGTCVPTLHACCNILPLGILSLNYFEKFVFSLLHSIGLNDWNHNGLGFAWIDAFFRICTPKTIFQSPWLLTLSPKSCSASYNWKFECCTMFCFWDNGWHGTDRQTDRWTGM